MKKNRHILYLSMGLSFAVHIALCSPLVLKQWGREDERHDPVVDLVSVQIASRPPMETVADKIEPKKKKPSKVLPKKKRKNNLRPKDKSIKKIKQKRNVQPDKQKKKTSDSLPVPNKPTHKDLAKKQTQKPVFGVTRESVRQDSDSAMAARVGNTLMIDQEEAFTPAEKVKAYHAIPPFALSRLPLYKIKVAPEYPEALKTAEREGSVLLAVTIDDQGNVVAIDVKRSDDELFTTAAIAALKQCRFTPGMQNGIPVTTIIDIPIKFVLDE